MVYVNDMHIEQDIDFELKKLRKLAWRMDALFYIPRTNISVGLDNILGLIPIIGDTITLAPSIYLIYRAKQLGATSGTLAYMIGNTLIDYVIGSIPIVGDIFDVVYNANIRNYRALERSLNRTAENARRVHIEPKVIELTS